MDKFDFLDDFIEVTPEFLETPQQAAERFYNSEFIFAKGVSRSLNDYKTRLNNNVIVMGTSG